MKIKNLVLVILMLIAALGCGSTRDKPKQFVCLDRSELKTLIKNYELTIPEKWCSFYGTHNELVHSPINIKPSMENYGPCYVYVLALDIENYKSKNVDDALQIHIKGWKERGNNKLEYESEFHPIYGKYYLMKYANTFGDQIQYKLKALFNYNNQSYVINYSATDKDFDNYLPQVIQMITTFKIIETP
ncbi:hypothetical protein SAMN04487989_101399 [Bizionia echini]|uniref:Gliding motility-associated lipoprotein GldD n=1 Tax=Bizionia echini TaxID=649333 RepID=A0A1I4YZ71_9FLAO|nr:hypothetical protein [Bizionia echini]SFN43356.1 hypothetical protein SAMN04487989_101399 [Bizionia echini]